MAVKADRVMTVNGFGCPNATCAFNMTALFSTHFFANAFTELKLDGSLWIAELNLIRSSIKKVEERIIFSQ
ncbi:unnamed protein product [Toxocara canis]|uniref:Uncharacterized protein n=1 Tax=Toxocara canis TaxID=6265 RepID=A0A183UUB9_TOXCA|nr:unnamed protein product [Toxocara canis]